MKVAMISPVSSRWLARRDRGVPRPRPLGDDVHRAELLRGEATLADWEGEGGAVGPAPVGPAPRGGAGGRCAPPDWPRFRVDEDLSYLGLTWLKVNDRADGREVGQGLTYAEARQLWRSCLSLERFSFLVRMRDKLRDLMHGRQDSPRPSSRRGAAGQLEPGRRWTER